MKEQDCDKKKSISQGKKHNIFYKMIMSRRAFGITYFVYGQQSFLSLPKEQRFCPPPLPWGAGYSSY